MSDSPRPSPPAQRELHGSSRLHPDERLFIIHVGKDRSPRWKMGGPLLPDFDTALEHYPHTVVHLEGGVQNALPRLLLELEVHVAVLGSNLSHSGLKILPLAEWVRSHLPCPFVLVRPDAVRTAKMRIHSLGGDGGSSNVAGSGPSLWVPDPAALSPTGGTSPRAPGGGEIPAVSHPSHLSSEAEPEAEAAAASAASTRPGSTGPVVVLPEAEAAAVRDSTLSHASVAEEVGNPTVGLAETGFGGVVPVTSSHPEHVIQVAGHGEGLPTAPSALPPPGTPAPVGPPPRRIAIAYSSFAVGRALMAFARERLLTPRDAVYVVHSFPRESQPGALAGNVMAQTRKLVRAMTLSRTLSPDAPADRGRHAVTEDNSMDFGAAELAGYDVQLGVVLRGDPRHALAAFCEAEAVDLLLVGARRGSRLRKSLSGGSVSAALADSGACPVLVVPHVCMGLAEDDGGEDSPGALHGALWGGPASPPSRPLSPIMGSPPKGEWEGRDALVASLHAELAQKDELIRKLRQKLKAQGIGGDSQSDDG
ncbi:hypothetical protein H632_c551p2 [Helicosporidium sp. ATCC 50920]|nr:hypothetical protein H632_c551p2 [Helicosporidium sp. ATCC 50920]|eukprot:KDD75685.1 hypothetical protein H632_c551p2 [Helicosporidium sp. ATCC 50920]